MELRKRKAYTPKPHKVVTVDVYVYRRKADGRLELVEGTQASYKVYER